MNCLVELSMYNKSAFTIEDVGNLHQFFTNHYDVLSEPHAKKLIETECLLISAMQSSQFNEGMNKATEIPLNILK